LNSVVSNRLPGARQWRQAWRACLVLGRVSNLPTVWSNCLAGWFLGGAGGSFWNLALLCLGATSLYMGGMFLNDAFDADFDRQHRKGRPIPTGAISVGTVWGLGIGWLVIGVLLFASFGWSTFLLALLLAGTIVLYDAVHKLVPFSPVLMAFCRFLLYLVAASTAVRGVTGLAIWSGLALGCYIAGLSFLARKESSNRALVKLWPCALLAVPILLAFIVNVGEYRIRALVLSLLMAIWVLYCLHYTFWKSNRNIGHTVAGLLAGIVLVDWLAVAGGTPILGVFFILFFLLALLAQRYIPAT
jgi:heme O synthase-like polyprenyltransferase